MDEVFDFLQDVLSQSDAWAGSYPWHWPLSLPGDSWQERPLTRYPLTLPRMTLVYRHLALYWLPREMMVPPATTRN